MRVIFICISVFVALMGLGWVIQGNDFFMAKVFAPKYEEVRRTTFEQSRAFNEGVAQELQGMWRDYRHTNDVGEKAAIRSLVVHRMAGYNIDMIQNSDLRSFVSQMENEQ